MRVMTASGNIEQEVLLLAGRSGSGKTSVSFEVSDQLQKADVAHCLVDGDNLDTAYPKPAHGHVPSWPSCRSHELVFFDAEKDREPRYRRRGSAGAALSTRSKPPSQRSSGRYAG